MERDSKGRFKKGSGGGGGGGGGSKKKGGKRRSSGMSVNNGDIIESYFWGKGLKMLEPMAASFLSNTQLPMGMTPEDVVTMGAIYYGRKKRNKHLFLAGLMRADQVGDKVFGGFNFGFGGPALPGGAAPPQLPASPEQQARAKELEREAKAKAEEARKKADVAKDDSATEDLLETAGDVLDMMDRLLDLAL